MQFHCVDFDAKSDETDGRAVDLEPISLGVKRAVLPGFLSREFT
jgi:hypothetical protein